MIIDDVKGYKMKTVKWFWVSIFIVGFFVRSTHVFQPINTESWREADVATIAKNFYINGTDIFHPQIAYGGNGPGYVESEFQLYSYLIATSYKIFGFWEQTGRVISLLISLATMLVFFKLSSFLLESTVALASSFFFSLSPILTVVSVAIQPESLMFFFYVCSAYAFLRWLDNPLKRYYWLAILCTALALLCKVTAANIGIFFLFMIVTKKGWKFLFKPQVMIFGILTTVPSILWYWYSHHFYVLYGNSLGVSNEYHWIGWDFFTGLHFIKGLVTNEIFNVWTLFGPLIVALALILTGLRKKEGFLLASLWFASASVFYIITVRSTGETWAWYYHIFSIPSMSILLGISVIELYNKYSQKLNIARKGTLETTALLKNSSFLALLGILTSCYIISCYIYSIKRKQTIFETSKYYICKDSLKRLIPENSLILVTGGFKQDKSGHVLAFDIGYFYYWLNRKGYSISVEDLALKNILAFKKEGVTYFVAEENILGNKPGLVAELKKNLKVVFECNGCILFSL